MHIDAAGVIVRDQNNKILVLHRKGFVPEGNKWGLPGGKVREGLGFLKTAQLKAKQEVSLDFEEKELAHLGEFKFIDGEGNDVVYETLVADLGKNSPQIKLNLEGHDYYKWESPEILVKQDDLMVGMYPILRKYIGINQEPPQLSPR